MSERVDVKRCASCGADHYGLVVHRERSGPRWTICPKTDVSVFIRDVYQQPAPHHNED